MRNNNVYNYINITNVINQLHLKKTYQKGNYIYTICPFCQKNSEREGYLKINTINNVYLCKKCEQSGSSVELYATLHYITTKEAFKRLLKEMPVLDNMPYVYNNPVKDDVYRDMVYRNFLKLQSLNSRHFEKLRQMDFSDKYINQNLFKSIENNTSKKKKICKQLQEQGLKLDGIPGFFQDIDFKWNYKSHNGIYIPVMLDNRIQGLRILLDTKYNLDTENIWFSSNNEYNGTKASNWPMILKNEATSWASLYNSNEQTDIIIATEMILAHKLFNNTNKTVIGVPNNIDKELILSLAKRMNISKVFLFVDKYTVLHTSVSVCKNIIQTLEQHNIEVDFRLALNDSRIGSDLIDICKKNEERNKKIA